MSKSFRILTIRFVYQDNVLQTCCFLYHVVV